MNYIPGTAEVLAEGHNDEGQRMRIMVGAVDYSGDLVPEGDCYVPSIYLGYSWGSFGLTATLNPNYFPVDEDYVMNAIAEMRDRFRDNWVEVSERWLRIVGAKDARVREVQVDRSSWGIMVSAFGQKWQDMTGVGEGYKITRDETEEFENWLKGEVSRVEVQVASHDCNCEYCGTEWVEMDDVPGMTVYADPWEVEHEISDKYAYVVEAMIAESGMIR